MVTTVSLAPALRRAKRANIVDIRHPAHASPPRSPGGMRCAPPGDHGRPPGIDRAAGPARPYPAAMVRTRCYLDGRLHAEGFPIADVSDHVAQAGHVAWFDIRAPDRKDLATIQSELGLHD